MAHRVLHSVSHVVVIHLGIGVLLVAWVVLLSRLLLTVF